MSKTTLTKAIPVLASLNIDKTEKFYQEKLGFKTDNKYPGYLVMSRDGINIHFWSCNDKYIAENTSCYIYVENIEPLYEEYTAAGVIHPNGKLETRDYGMRDFAILDEDGNLIKFGEAVD